MGMMENRIDGKAGDVKEFLSFQLGEEEYGIDILAVREIRAYEKPTRIANTPAFIRGVINLRGVIVPIVDLRIKFGMAAPQYNSLTVVIILKVFNRVVGIVVDSVSDVVALKPGDMRPAPEFNSRIQSTFIRGLATVQERMLILMDIEALMASDDMALVEPVAEAA
ncbi:MAG: chemotaxis protein CheW [Betaproteobacteria bacterium]